DCSSDATETSPVAGSPYDITCAVGSLTADNYDFPAGNFVAGKLQVIKVHLTVAANNKSRAYGDANPSFDAQISGFVNGETLASSGVTGVPSCTSPAISTSPVAGYTITCALGTLAAANYDFPAGNFVA